MGTETVIPSGILWSVTANISIAERPSEVRIPSGVLLAGWRWGVSISRKSIKRIPPIKPTRAGIQATTCCASASFIAGMSNDQTDAATITPAAKPKSVFCILAATLSPRNMALDEPITVPTNGIIIMSKISPQFINATFSLLQIYPLFLLNLSKIQKNCRKLKK